ncbi:hypothetical protein [Algibacter mikhailovii]|uniref:DUF3278 domain-containing protein n=1 Tax=Algibacter mikhailovii TaxID=425498 RepID=A0A918R7U6_9FLAO|nr:hypothetical protein [Algibacter mikhailovii]GGZ88990.1 hypothetical protein GCM10007028_28970 [Algibacter mikhailovii]
MCKEIMNFEELKSQWEKQPTVIAPPNGVELIVKKTALLKKKQRITNVVLGVTIVVLIGFFFYIAAYNNVKVALALGLMVGSLLTRIIIERFSIEKLGQVNLAVKANTFKNIITNYYKQRIKTHYIITPIVFAAYFLGFSLLLPFFKEGLSTGFYYYILVSGFAFFIVMGIFIRKQVLNEISILKQMQA